MILIGKRYVVALLTSIGLLLLTVIQTNFSITNTIILNGQSNEDNSLQIRWSSIQLAYLNSIFYFGYVLSHIPSGFLVHQYSATKIFLYPLILLFILNIFVPIFIQMKFYYLIGFIRFLQGLCAGSSFPSSHGILSNWCPPCERGRFGALVYSGLYAGPILGFFLGAVLTTSNDSSSIYYFTSLMGLSWSFIFLIIVYDKPNEDRSISSEELIFIEKGISDVKYLLTNDKNANSLKIPWKSILFSLPVWSICLAHFARGWTFYFLLTNQPAFLNAFGFNITENGTFGLLPHLFKVCLAFSSGFLADFMKLKLLWSTTTVRKFMTCTGYLTEGTCLFFMCFVRNSFVGILLLTIGVGTSGLIVSGWHLNHQDLSQRFASIIAGFTALIGTSAGILSPIVAGILTENQDINGWRSVLFICSFVLYFCSIFYFLFGSAEIQIWANGDQKQEKVRYNSERFPQLFSPPSPLDHLSKPIQNTSNSSPTFPYQSFIQTN